VNDSFRTPAGPRLDAALTRLAGLVDWERRAREAGGRRVMRVDTGPVRDLLERLGAPQQRFRAVHVAGSKGKGSTASLVAAGLRAAGVRTGVYASPHVTRLHERVRIGHDWIADEPLADALERALAAREAALAEQTAGATATWFDVVTAAAFRAFADAGLEWVVVECGLGGRLDSTNVLAAEVCVITSIALEHTAILGDTRADIAAEKAGIVHDGAVVVCGLPVAGDEAGEVIARVCSARGARLVTASSGATIDERNLALAGAVLDELERRGVAPGGAALLDEATRSAARLPGRLERRAARGVPVVIDGAHVPESVADVLTQLRADPALPGPPTVILALGADKDADRLLKVLSEGVDRVLCTSVGEGPYADPAVLSTWAAAAGLVAEKVATPRMAFEHALELAADGGWVLAIGSLHLAGELLRILDADEPDIPC
jgi:dihydrofolate synthase/folylpolyglutamate synthase